MPFLAPALVGAIGLTGVAATAAEVALGLGFSAALSYGVQAITPKPGDRGAMGHALQRRYNPNTPCEIAVGYAATAGTQVYRNVYGKQEYVETVLSLSDFYPCDGIEAIWIDGEERTWNAGTGEVSGFPNMRIRFHAGTWSQSADADLVAHAVEERWTSAHRGRGRCYAVVQMKYDAKEYPNGEPAILFVLRGAKFYDWRKDSTRGGSGSHRWGNISTYQWTRNPKVIAYNWCAGIHLNGEHVAGLSAPLDMLPLDVWTAAANACDENVSLKGGGTEKRYSADGLISTATPHREVIRALVTASAGEFVYTGGLFLPLAGVSEAPVMSITDDDLMADGEVEIVQDAPSDDLFNAVFGSYSDPAQQWESTAAPPRISSDDALEDGIAGYDGDDEPIGTRLSKTFPLDFVSSGTQAQRVLEILRRQNRYQGTASLPLRARCTSLEAGDVVSWTSDRYGYVNKTFRVRATSVPDDRSRNTVQLKETASAIYAWNAAVDELDPQNPATVAPGAEAATVIEGLSVGNVVIAAGGSGKRPAIPVSWTPPDDPSIVAIKFEYRRVGDDAALRDRADDPSTGGVHLVMSGVQGETEYELRALPVCVPERDNLSWTAWLPTGSASAPFEVDVAALATTVPPDTITAEMLAEQERFVLGLVTATDQVLGSLTHMAQRALTEAQTVAKAQIKSIEFSGKNAARLTVERQERLTAQQALAQQITTAFAQIDQNAAQLTNEITARADGQSALAQEITSAVAQIQGVRADLTSESTARANSDGAFAQQLLTVNAAVAGANASIANEATARATADSALGQQIFQAQSTLNNQSFTVQVIQQTIDGIEGRVGLVLNANGDVVGLAQLDGSAMGTTFTVAADKFLVALRNQTGGGAVPVFAIQNVNGVPKLAFRGDMYADGAFSARHISSISLDVIAAALNSATIAATIRSANTANGSLLLNFANPEIRLQTA